MTQPGTVLGTAAYMSPEQATGKPVDKRADIWAFGCVLFECLTGKRPYQGESITETVASVLKSEPDWTLLPAGTPTMVRSVLRRCLQKDPGLRLRDIGDAWLELEAPAVLHRIPHRPSAISDHLAGCECGCHASRRHPRRLVVDEVFSARFFRASVITSTIKVEPGHWLDGRRWVLLTEQRPSRTAMAISGDGRFVVYSAIDENPGPQAKPQLYLRRMDQAEAKPIRGDRRWHQPLPVTRQPLGGILGRRQS